MMPTCQPGIMLMHVFVHRVLPGLVGPPSSARRPLHTHQEAGLKIGHLGILLPFYGTVTKVMGSSLFWGPTQCSTQVSVFPACHLCRALPGGTWLFGTSACSLMVYNTAIYWFLPDSVAVLFLVSSFSYLLFSNRRKLISSGPGLVPPILLQSLIIPYPRHYLEWPSNNKLSIVSLVARVLLRSSGKDTQSIHCCDAAVGIAHCGFLDQSSHLGNLNDPPAAKLGPLPCLSLTCPGPAGNSLPGWSPWTRWPHHYEI